MISASFFLISVLVLRLTLERRVRKQAIPADWIYDGPYDGWWGLGFPRAILFGLCCVFPHVNNYDYNRLCYNEVDIQAFANRFEKFWGWCFVLGLFGIFFFGGLTYLMEWLGLVPRKNS